MSRFVDSPEQANRVSKQTPDRPAQAVVSALRRIVTTRRTTGTLDKLIGRYGAARTALIVSGHDDAANADVASWLRLTGRLGR